MSARHTLQDLHDAFAELEHRADLAEMDRRVDPADRPKRRHHLLRPTPVVATVAAAVVLVMGAVWIVPRGDAGAPAGVRVAEGPPTTHKELEQRFRTILGDSATFVVAETATPPDSPASGKPRPDGLSIAGPLTAHGVTGWFDLTIYPDRPCNTPAANCPLDMSAQTVESGWGTPMNVVSHLSVRVGLNGRVEIVLRVSNERDPGHELPNKPIPLSRTTVTKILDSPLWW